MALKSSHLELTDTFIDFQMFYVSNSYASKQDSSKLII